MTEAESITDRIWISINRGQTGADIRYLARTRDGVIFVTDRGMTLSGQGQAIPAFELLDSDLSANWAAEAATAESASYRTTVKLLGTNCDFSQPQASIPVVVK